MGSRDREIDQVLPIEEAVWKIQRVGWIAMGMFILAGGLGLLGEGPVSANQAEDAAHRLKVSFNKFLNLDAPAELKVQVSAVPPGGDFRVSLPREYAERFEIKQVVPDPVAVVSQDGDLVYHFRGGARGGAAAIHYDLQSRRMGWVKGRVKVLPAEGRGDSPLAEVSFGQWVYP